MGVVCNLIVQPVVRLLQILATVIEYVLVAICRVITALVEVVKEVLKYVCETVVRTVCDTVCGVVCGICDFFCGLFGCSCGCRDVCESVCETVTDVVCAWTYVLETVLEYVTRLVCNYILQAILRLVELIVTFVVMVLTWVCSIVDLIIRWLLCWTRVAEVADDILGDTRERRFLVAPKIVPNRGGRSDWFVYVGNPDAGGSVDPNGPSYILSDRGRPLLPVFEPGGGPAGYFEVATRGDLITGQLVRREGRLVPGRPFLYYADKVLEIASHLFGDIFASGPNDDGTGADFRRNLFTYGPNVQAWLAADGALAANHYNDWPDKYSNPASGDYFGDGTIPDIGLRVESGDDCGQPTNTFLHLTNDATELAPRNTGIAEEMSCGAGQTLTFAQTDYLMRNRAVGSAVTTYFVSRYAVDETQVGCNDLLGYTVVTFRGAAGPLFVTDSVLPFHADTNRMMSRIVQNVSDNAPDIVRVAETYLHELGHQSGLLHDENDPVCRDVDLLNVERLMHPGGRIRRTLTRMEWCLIRGTWYVTSAGPDAFTQAAELPDSGSTPKPKPEG